MCEAQDMFGPPEPAPCTGNILPLIWNYVIKLDGTRKARCVANGSPRLKGSVTLSRTCAAALEQSGAQLFWALSAINNHVITGADASNAFAEAEPPEAPQCVRVDDAFREWRTKEKGNPDIPLGHVVKVNHALQGHPESPQLWSKKIDGVLHKLKFKNSTHEPCTCGKTLHDNAQIFFLCQVDDFLTSAPTQEIADVEFQHMQRYLKQPLKILGAVTAFNGMDISQTKDCIKISCHTHLKKVLEGHQWEQTQRSGYTNTPLNPDKRCIEKLDTCEVPTDVKLQNQLQTKMGFKCRQAIGELLFTAVTCRPDLMHAVIKLSQFSNNPHEIHCNALKNVFRFVRSTDN